MEVTWHRCSTEYTILIDEEDYHLLNEYNWVIYSSPRHHTNYVVTASDGTPSLRLHRLIMSPEKDKIIDHINGNGLDNRKCNLRITTSLGNNQNARKRKNARTSAYKGVHLDTRSGKWKCQIQYNKNKLSGGTFKTEKEAALKYNELAKLHFGEFAKLNIIED